MTIVRRAVVAAVMTALLAAALPISAFAAVPALTGELLFYSNARGFAPGPPLPIDVGTLTASVDCDDNTGSFTFSGSGNANGPYPGTYQVSGSVTLVDGTATDFSMSFAIYNLGGSLVASGSLDPDPSVQSQYAFCSEDEADPDNDIEASQGFSIQGRFTYSADIVGVGSESGFASAEVSCLTVEGSGGPCDGSETIEVRFLGGTAPRTATGTGSAETAPNATANDPLATSVVAPEDVPVSIGERDYSVPWDGGSWIFLTRQVDIAIGEYDENDEFVDFIADPGDPIRLTFRVHLSRLTELGIDPNDVVVVRDGEAAEPCDDADYAAPDPCVESRDIEGDELVLVVLTTHASLWGVAVVRPPAQYTFDGFMKPVDNPGEDNFRNIAKAGQAIPLRWRLTDPVGAPVTDLTSSSVQVSVDGATCERGAPSELVPVESTRKSGLQNLGDGYYQFTWATPKSYANSCVELTLELALSGGTVSATALFEFRR